MIAVCITVSVKVHGRDNFFVLLSGTGFLHQDFPSVAVDIGYGVREFFLVRITVCCFMVVIRFIFPEPDYCFHTVFVHFQSGTVRDACISVKCFLWNGDGRTFNSVSGYKLQNITLFIFISDRIGTALFLPVKIKPDYHAVSGYRESRSIAGSSRISFHGIFYGYCFSFFFTSGDGI